jgi:hypothetical protein
LPACVFAGFCVLPISAALAGGNAPNAKGTPPPQIYHIVTTPLCARLHERIRPAVAMILQNDRSIAKSPPLFKKYQVAVFGGIDPANNPRGTPAPSSNDSINNSSPATRMALQQMSYLVSPIAQGLLGAQDLLSDADLLKPTGNPSDDQQLAKIKAQLLETLSFQSASLDLINGFVATQQMGELQHAGEEYLNTIAGNNESSKPIQQPASPSPLQDPNAPGLPQNPFSVDPTAIPGLAVGYNPLSRIEDGMQWLHDETMKRENAAAATVNSALAECGPAPAPARTSPPHSH